MFFWVKLEPIQISDPAPLKKCRFLQAPATVWYWQPIPILDSTYIFCLSRVPRLSFVSYSLSLSLRYENVAPMDYFANLVSSFELQMADYRKQIDQTERHLQVGDSQRFIVYYCVFPNPAPHLGTL